MPAACVGLAINRFTSNGIVLQTGGGNIVERNRVGTNPAGTADLGNGAHGVVIFESPNNVVGGPTPSEGNVLSGNGVHGVFISRLASTGNDVQSNLIGVGADGSTALGNSAKGVRIDRDASGNNIDGNVISANLTGGVIIAGVGTTNNTLAGNNIGTDTTGLLDRGNLSNGVLIDDAPGNNIGVPGDGNLISGNAARGVYIIGAAASGNMVQGNLIGLDVTGNTALPNDNHGVFVSGAPNNTLGGTTAGAGNVISGNGAALSGISGVFITGSSASGNKIEGNLIGTNAAGTSAVPNGEYGVVIRSPNNTVGGTVAGAGNVVSGNLLDGVAILLPDATGNVVAGNLIGTDITGTVDVGNSRSGVLIWKASDNTVGGLTAAERNIVSGNDLYGVRITTSLGSNVVQGNYIGTDITGTVALPNSDSGVQLANVQGATIGGSAPGAGNLISGNVSHGIVLVGAGTLSNGVRGNVIGFDSTGTTALGNGTMGVWIGSGAHDNTIGGVMSGEGNVIAHNTVHGVATVGGTGNAIERNSIFSNGGLGINLGSDGVTANRYVGR